MALLNVVVDKTTAVSIPMTVFGGLQFLGFCLGFRSSGVSIPMTVFGGLQYGRRHRRESKRGRFNTDDGIWRAAIASDTLAAPSQRCFNTDDGIWRAAILCP